MKIAYIAHTRFPTEKAHGHQVARVCEALTALGHDVTLIAPGVHNEVRESYTTYYHLTHVFPLKHLPTKDALLSPVIPGRFAMRCTMQSYGKELKQYLRENDFDLLYARSPLVLAPILASHMPVVLELHTLPRVRTQKFVKQCMHCKRIVCLTTPMKDELVSWGVNEEHILVEGDAVDLESFSKVDAGAFPLNTNKPV
ncbi:MAG: glycosyltransferase, partial [Candidatus Peregrinibacteria bacterium]|nr:glycosyltransferase [Candidatus Peregrinibacteria bacterium]